MNLSKVVTSIISQLGLYHVTLPFKDSVTGVPIPTENVIRNVLVDTTIPLYSQFEPWKRSQIVPFEDLKIVDFKNSIFLLPVFLTITNVLYVIDVQLPYRNTRGTYGDIAPSYGINRSVQGVITSQSYMMLAGQMRAEPTFDYLGYNKIKLLGYPKCDLTFIVACEHDPNGESIEEGCFDSFLELAMLNTKMFLYNNLKYFNAIPSAFGEVKLNIEDYQNAESEQKELLERWRDSFHLDMGWEEWM